MAANYFELEIAFNPGNIDEIYNELYLNGITSIIEENGVIKASLPEDMINTLEAIRDNLINNNIVKNHSIFISRFENMDWNKEWEKTIEPVYIKDKIIIYPSWKKDSLVNTESRILIEINPKMSFGTGHNETTQLILELMSDYMEQKDNFVLDYGCGTAVLAIAAAKLGAGQVIAIDIDDDSIDNAKEYISLNRTENNIKLYKSDITGISENGFDVVCANITSGVIIPNLNNIYNKLKPAGKLFITGILIEEKPGLINQINKAGFTILDNRDKAEWTGFYAIKKDSKS